MNHKNKTKFVSTEDARANRRWYLFDAKGKILGRFASEIAKILMGKHATNFTPNNSSGDGVVVINIEEIKVSGNKEAQKLYTHHSGYIGGLKQIPYRVMKEKHPERILLHAIKGMLPKTKQGRAQIKKLHVFKGKEHNMQAQKPIAVNI